MTSPETALDGCWFLSGPTASGKTAVGIELAERLGAEIISVDSMAMFRGMDIATAKPSVEQQARARHHLVDVLDPDEESSIADYRQAALEVANELRRRGRGALFVGGSPLYLKALLRGLLEAPGADWDLRREIEAWGERFGSEALHARLAEVDPQAAKRLHPNDTRRLIRAIEVFERTGQPISQSQTQFHDAARARVAAFVLAWPRETLYRRIDERVDAMFRAGLVDETRRLLESEHPPGRTARQAVGYREVIAHLEQGVALDETIALVKTKTRQFAKRQLTWFRRLPELAEIAVDEPFDPAEIAEGIGKAGVRKLARGED